MINISNRQRPKPEAVKLDLMSSEWHPLPDHTGVRRAVCCGPDLETLREELAKDFGDYGPIFGFFRGVRSQPHSELVKERMGIYLATDSKMKLGEQTFYGEAGDVLIFSKGETWGVQNEKEGVYWVRFGVSQGKEETGMEDATT